MAAPSKLAVVRVATRPKPYPEVNGHELVIGDTDASIGHGCVYLWSKRKDDPTVGPDNDLQIVLTHRLAVLLATDPECQDILRKLDVLARESKAWEEAPGG